MRFVGKIPTHLSGISGLSGISDIRSIRVLPIYINVFTTLLLLFILNYSLKGY